MQLFFHLQRWPFIRNIKRQLTPDQRVSIEIKSLFSSEETREYSLRLMANYDTEKKTNHDSTQLVGGMEQVFEQTFVQPFIFRHYIKCGDGLPVTSDPVDR